MEPGRLPCYEVVSTRHQDVLLTEHVLLLLGLHDVLLLQALESEHGGGPGLSGAAGHKGGISVMNL